LDWSEVQSHAPSFLFHRDLIALRKTDPVLSSVENFELDGATLSENAFVLRWFSKSSTDRLLIVNLDRQLTLDSIAEPLIAPPRGHEWSLAWNSEDAKYGGHGVISPFEDGGRGRWNLAAQSATLLIAIPRAQQSKN
jgi:maltooligosyltrehalose trehalohydrolase